LDNRLQIEDETLNVIDEKLQAIFLALIRKTSTKSLSLSRTVLECFASLSHTCEDEELEDLAYVILDIYSIKGYYLRDEKTDIQKV
jgi:separase